MENTIQIAYNATHCSQQRVDEFGSAIIRVNENVLTILAASNNNDLAERHDGRYFTLKRDVATNTVLPTPDCHLATRAHVTNVSPT